MPPTSKREAHSSPLAEMLKLIRDEKGLNDINLSTLASVAIAASALLPAPAFGVVLAAGLAAVKISAATRINNKKSSNDLVKRRARQLSIRIPYDRNDNLQLEAAIRVLEELRDTEIIKEDIFEKAQPAAVIQSPGVGAPLSQEDAIARLNAIAIEEDSTDWIDSDILGVTEVAKRFGVARSTVDNWRRSGRAVGLQRGPRNYVYPERQFTRSGPVDGLRAALSHFPNHEEAWEWLVVQNPYTNEQAPIERLHQGFLEEVECAAAGAAD